MLFDLQVHTQLGSPDSEMTPGQAAAAARQVGLQGVALTEHLECDLTAALAEFEAAGVVALPGREVSCLGAHLLLVASNLGSLRDVPRTVGPDDAVLRLNDVGVIWAHPGAPSGSSLYPPHLPQEELLQGVVHCVEVLNGKHLHLHQTVEVAEGLRARLNVGGVAGSDAHGPAEVGRCATELAASSAREAVAEIRAGRTSPVLVSSWGPGGYDYRTSLKEYLV